ncbi:hypothetical protein Ct61P_02483 [Colletotrichum tofieldiae]|nr:hypothetical protein Ct61P_02483 [Colletotrichum tofieldiae]
MTMKRRDPGKSSTPTLSAADAYCATRATIHLESVGRFPSASRCNAAQGYARPATISNTRTYPYPINIAVRNEG